MTVFYRVSAHALVRDEMGRLLLIRDDSGFWTVPGGGFQDGETPEEALQREVLEEIGVRCRIVDPRPFVWAHYGSELATLQLGFHAELEEGSLRFSSEHLENRYVEPSELTRIELHPRITELSRFLG